MGHVVQWIWLFKVIRGHGQKQVFVEVYSKSFLLGNIGSREDVKTLSKDVFKFREARIVCGNGRGGWS